jgi:hypothetical protein
MRNNFKFIEYNYLLYNVLTNTDIDLAMNKFHSEELINKNSKLTIFILFKIKSIEGD